MGRHYSSLAGVQFNNTWITIGSFDGVHIGHQQLIKELHRNAHHAGAESAVITFYPHPAAVLKRRSGPFYLTTPTEKVELLDELGTDIVLTHPFTLELSQSSARDFVLYLYEHFRFRQLWVGYDFALGNNREGNVHFLQQLGDELNYDVHVVNPITMDGQTISSTYIRSLITDGFVEVANRYLGRPYKVSGVVIHGDGRGKTIGIPTANLEAGNEKLIPGAGVYACRVVIDDKIYPGAINIGIRPTFERTDTLAHIEAHILDYSDNLYGRQITIQFVSRLREEVRFQSVDELIQQIHQDIYKTREIITG